jgi:hypothetical protein
MFTALGGVQKTRPLEAASSLKLRDRPGMRVA